jgi:hypothetical protein
VDFEREAFDRFMDGKPVNFMEIPGFKEWIAGIAKKRASGARIINLNVLDLPLSDYIRFGINSLRISKKSGQESRFVERKQVLPLTRGFQDFWLFDSKTVMLVNYDKEGHFLSESNPITDPEVVSKHILVRDGLVEASLPMEAFLRQNKADLISRPKPKRNKSKS